MTAPPTCDAIRKLLSAHLDDELPAPEAAEVRAHLASCPACRTELELLRLTVGALHGLPDLPAPAGILAGVRAGMEPDPQRLLHIFRRRWGVGIPVGALATLLVVIGVVFFQARYPALKQEVVAPTTPAIHDEAQRPAPAAPLPATPSPAARTMPVPAVTKGLRPRVPVPAQRADKSALKIEVAVQKRKEAAPAPEEMNAERPAAAAPARENAPVAAPQVAQDLRLQPSPAREMEILEKAPQPLAEGKVARMEEKAASPRAEFAAPAPEPAPTAVMAPAAPIVSVTTAPADPVGIDRDQAKPAFRAMGGEKRAASAESPASVSVKAGEMKKMSAAAKDELRPESETEVLYLYAQGANDVEDLREILKQQGGRLLEVRTLDFNASQQAAAPVQNQLGAAQQVRQGWQIQATVPHSNIGPFVAALQRRQAYQLLQRQAAEPPAGKTPELQEIRINLFR